MIIKSISRPVGVLELVINIALTKINKSKRRDEILEVKKWRETLRLTSLVVGKIYYNFDYYHEMEITKVSLKILKSKHCKKFYPLLDYFKVNIIL